MTYKYHKSLAFWSFTAATLLIAGCANKSETGPYSIEASYLIDGFSADAASIVSGGVLLEKGELGADTFAYVEFHGFGDSASPILLCKRAGRFFFYTLKGAPASRDLYAWLSKSSRAVIVDGDEEWLKAALDSSGVTFGRSEALQPLAELLMLHLTATRPGAHVETSNPNSIRQLNYVRTPNGKRNVAPAMLKACTA